MNDALLPLMRFGPTLYPELEESFIHNPDSAEIAHDVPALRRQWAGVKLRKPDAAIIDLAGYNFPFPGQPLTLNRTLEMNDHRVRIVEIANASAPFTTFPVMFTRYTQALNFVGRERNQLSFVLVKAQPGTTLSELKQRLQQTTALKAATTNDFGWMTIIYYIRNTGIPVNFGLTWEDGRSVPSPRRNECSQTEGIGLAVVSGALGALAKSAGDNLDDGEDSSGQ